ncbi:hypothetical protein AVEN_197179-1 [Araneus ventricosus]|uniref:Uncharacterized protein n=1 Tax=Araneus ventricosus TaxID=182803 RepID=A0A4Y2Q414_ARAVE|nr:hypothetical protein AVEN_197179-1 [Araneus ventricosus]
MVSDTQEARDFLGVTGDLSLKIKTGNVQIEGLGDYLRETYSRSKVVEILVKVHYETRQVIGYGGCVEWPPRSPDPNPLDFFLWGYIKQRVYAPPPPTLQELRNRFTDVVPACHLPRCTMCSGKCSPVSRCVLLLKDTILSMTDR